MSAAGVKAGGCSVIAKVAVVTVSVVTVGVIVAIAVPLALRNNNDVSQSAENNVTTTPLPTVTGATNAQNINSTDSTTGGTAETTTPETITGDNFTTNADTTVTYNGSTTQEDTSGTTKEITQNLASTTSPLTSTTTPQPDTTVPYNGSTTQEDTSGTTKEITQNLGSTTTPLTSTTTPQPTTTPYFECTSGYNRTIILMKADIDADDYLFYRGGVQASIVTALTNFTGRCPSVAGSTNPCVLSIQHRMFVASGGFNAYNAWAAGDNFLDWYGFESTQGQYTQAVKSLAEGSPAVLTSSNVTKQNYLAYNTFGDDYWAMDVCMDCTGTVQGWFEVLGYSNKTLLETQVFTIAQTETCSGTAEEATATRPFSSVYHVGYCGRVNVFRFGDGNCTINQL